MEPFLTTRNSEDTSFKQMVGEELNKSVNTNKAMISEAIGSIGSNVNATLKP